MEAFLSVMSNFQTAIDATATGMSSMGSATRENERAMDSLAGRVSKLQSAWQNLSNSLISSDFLKGAVSALTEVVNFLSTDIGKITVETGLLIAAFALLNKPVGEAVGALSKFSTAVAESGTLFGTLGGKLKSSITDFTLFGLKLSGLLTLFGGVAVVAGFVAAMDLATVSVKEQEASVESLQNKIDGLRSEYDALKNSGDLTEAGQAHLAVLDAEIKANEQILAQEQKKLFYRKYGEGSKSISYRSRANEGEAVRSGQSGAEKLTSQAKSLQADIEEYKNLSKEISNVDKTSATYAQTVGKLQEKQDALKNSIDAQASSLIPELATFQELYEAGQITGEEYTELISLIPQVSSAYSNMSSYVDAATNTQETYNGELDSTAERLEDVTKAVKDYQDALLRDTEHDTNFKAYSEAWNNLKSEIDKGRTSTELFRESAKLIFGEDWIGSVGASTEAIKKAVENTKGLFSDAESGGEGFKDAIWELTKGTGVLKDDLGEIGRVYKDANKYITFDIPRENIGRLAESLGITEDATNSLIEALEVAHGTAIMGDIADYVAQAEEMGTALTGVGDKAIVNFDKYREALKTAGKDVFEVEDIIKRLSTSGDVVDVSIDVTGEDAVENAAKKLEELGAITDTVDGKKLNLGTDKFVDFSEAVGLSATQAAALGKSFGMSIPEIVEVIGAIGATDSELANLAKSLGLSGSELANLAKSLGLSGSELANLAKSLGLSGSELANLAKSLGFPVSQIMEMAQSAGVAAEAAEYLGLSWDGVSSLSLSKPIAGVEGLIGKTNEATTATDKAKQKVQEFGSTTGEAKLKAKDNASSTISKVDKKLNAYNKKSVSATLSVKDRATSVIQSINARLQSLKSKTIDVVTRNIVQNPNGFMSMSGHAKGAQNFEGGMTLVGEEKSPSGQPKPELVVANNKAALVGTKGPEIVNLPKGAQIFSNKDTKKILGNTNITGIPAFANGNVGYESLSYNFQGEAKGSNPVIITPETKEAIKITNDLIITAKNYADAQSKVNVAIKEGKNATKDANEAFENQQKIFNEETDILEHKSFLLEQNNATYGEQAALIEKTMERIHNQANWFRSNGLSENSQYVRDLQKQYWSLYDKLTDLRQNYLSELSEDLEVSLSAFEHKTSLLEHQKDTEEERVKIAKEAQDKLHTLAEKYRAMGVSEDDELIVNLQNQWWDWEATITDIYKEVSDSYTDMLDEQKKNTESAFSYLASQYGKEADFLESQKKDMEDYFQKRIDELKELNDEEDRNIALEKAREKVALASAQKVYMFKDGEYRYVDNLKDVNDAKEELAELEKDYALEDSIKAIEEARDQELAYYEGLIEKVRGYEEEWGGLVDRYEENQNRLLAEQILGVSLENQNWQERIENAALFMAQYDSILRQIAEIPNLSLEELYKKGGTSSNLGHGSFTLGRSSVPLSTYAKPELFLLSDQAAYNVSGNRNIPDWSSSKQITQQINIDSISLQNVTNAEQFINELRNFSTYALQATTA